MNLLSHFRTAPRAVENLVTPIARVKWRPVMTCSFNKFHKYPGHQNVMCENDFNSLRHSETTRVHRSRLLINNSLDQQQGIRVFSTQDYGKVPPTYSWKPKHHPSGALYSNRGHDTLAYLKSSESALAQLSVSVRHYAVAPIYPIPENLDPWKYPEEELGTTFTSYLSDADVMKVRIISESGLEMFNSVFRSHPKENIKKPPIKEDKVFGVPLELLSNKDLEFKKKSPHLKIPSLLYMMLQFIYKEGLNSEDLFSSKIPSSTKVKKLKDDIEANFYKNKNYEIPSKEYNAHVVAVVLKDFLAELPTPLMSTPEFDFFLDLFENDIMLKHRLEGINLFILLMTPQHRDSLQMLLALLHQITKNKRLTVQTCADIFAPILFAVHPSYSEQEKIKKKKEFVDITRLLVHYNEFLFTVPPDTLEVVRNLHYYGPKPDRNWIPNVSIALKLPDSEEVVKHMPLSPTTTAEEVLAFATKEPLPVESYMKKLRSEVLGKKSKTSNFLWEMGGNIDERALEPQTKILSLYRVNTLADFVIKSWVGYSSQMQVKFLGEIVANEELKKR